MISKPSVEDLFKHLLHKTKDFKYQITLNVLLRKCKYNTERGFASFNFNSTTKAVINSKYYLNNSFQEFFIKINN